MQVLGSVQTKAGRCIAFPNIYQHCVSPFELDDPSRPGHRKILALFLVDPNVRIPSTTNVAPQQRDWIFGAMRQCGPESRLSKLPDESLQMIVSATPGLMTRDEAFAYRKELMEERTQAPDEEAEEHLSFFGETFNMCEH